MAGAFDQDLPNSQKYKNGAMNAAEHMILELWLSGGLQGTQVGSMLSPQK